MNISTIKIRKNDYRHSKVCFWVSFANKFLIENTKTKPNFLSKILNKPQDQEQKSENVIILKSNFLFKSQIRSYAPDLGLKYTKKICQFDPKLASSGGKKFFCSLLLADLIS